MPADVTGAKYLIKARISTDGVVEHPDVVGAIFGQTEGLLGEEMDLRDLQRGAKIGRITVELDSKRGRTEGIIEIPSNLDQVETSILGAALETIDRVGPCTSKIEVLSIEDVRVSKRRKVLDRAKSLLKMLTTASMEETHDIGEKLREELRVAELVYHGADRLPAGPNVGKTDSIIVVEGRNDVLNLLRAGINNAIAVEGTSIPKTIIDLSRDYTTTAFVDGDRGGELILKEILFTCDVDFVARAPEAREVEELSEKQIMKCLKNKVPAEQYMETYGIKKEKIQPAPAHINTVPPPAAPAPVHAQTPSAVQPAPQPKVAEHKGIFGLISGRKEEKAEESFEKYKTSLDKLSGTLKSIVYGADGAILGNDIPVRDLADSLRSISNPAVLVFDGVVTQRILDVAGEKGVKMIIASKMGPISKFPANLKVLTKDNLQ